MLANPVISSSVKNPASAKEYLNSHSLLPFNEDPSHHLLSKAILDLTFTSSEMGTPVTNALRAIAILIDSLSPLSSSPYLTNSNPTTNKRLTHQTQQTDPLPQNHELQAPRPLEDLTIQILEIKSAIKELCNVAQSNDRSADQIKQIVKETRNELHAASEVVSASAELIANSLNSTPTPTSATTTSSPTNSHSSNIDQQSIETALQEIKSLISKGPVSSLPYSYKDALINSSTPRQLATTTNQPSPVEQARAKAAVKERQLLIDLANEHPIRHQIYSHDEMISLFQTALDEIKENGPDLKIKSLFQLKNGGILLELSSKEAVEWAKQPERRQRFINATGGKLNIKDRLYNLVVPFVPIWTALEDNETLRFIEEDSKIPANTIASARWIKPIAKRKPFQQFAHAMFSLTSPAAANTLLKDGIYVNRACLRAIKDKKEPICCLKCQQWGHIAQSCKADKDTCGTCAGNHRTPDCPSENEVKCINCDSTNHSSSSRKCPDFIQRCIALNAKTPENNMPYFPTDEEWTLVPIPPKATGDLVQTRPPRHPTQGTNKERQPSQGTHRDRMRQTPIPLSRPSTPTSPPPSSQSQPPPPPPPPPSPPHQFSNSRPSSPDDPTLSLEPSL